MCLVPLRESTHALQLSLLLYISGIDFAYTAIIGGSVGSALTMFTQLYFVPSSAAASTPTMLTLLPTHATSTPTKTSHTHCAGCVAVLPELRPSEHCRLTRPKGAPAVQA